MTHHNTSTLARMAFVLLIVVATLLFPTAAHAATSPWGAGTTYNAKTGTLVVKRGTHTIRDFRKTYKRRYVTIDRLVIRGGTTKIKGSYGMLRSLTVTGGKLISTSELSILGNARVSGGTVSITIKRRGGYGLSVSEDLVIKGGKVIVKTVKESCSAVHVSGDMIMRKGTLTAITKGKSSDALDVMGYLKVTGGTIKAQAVGKNAMGIQVYGDYLQSGGTVRSTVARGDSIRCSDLFKVTGGTISSVSKDGVAIYSGEPASIKLGCLGTIRGALPQGACFKAGGATYRVLDNYGPSVAVVSGGGSAAVVTFGGVRYAVAG